ncbi:SH3 domain-containing protein [Salipaludibacillus daqingensis]|uniref:SH3 domain-containing protein n=1 Tax=Salipaludibacillus daqingensis TaxID=3041001 RepID=UPI002474669D|nr:SH3 domain-containing protein [Salipaludibacillus daqingensis]
MKKVGFLFLTMILVVGFIIETGQGSINFAHAETMEKGEITASSLNIRSQPSSSSSVIGGYARGAKVDLHEKSGSWYKVRFNNRWGYIHGNFVKVTSTSNGSNASSIGSGEITATNLNVRASASSSASIISSVRRGTKVDLLGKSGSWYKIKVGSRDGFIHGDYVKVTSSNNSSSSSNLGSGEVTASNLNVRASASSSASIISSLRRGTKVDLLGKSGSWYKIKVGSRDGYIHSNFVKVSSSSSGSDSSSGGSSSSDLGTGEITASNLNVRASASSSASIISSLRRGTKVDLLGKSGSWYKIKVGSRDGYIHSNFVKASTSSSGSDSSSGGSSSSNLGSGEVTASNLNVRASASSSASIISSLRRGTKVDLLGKSGSWYKIKVGSRDGYIHDSFVKASTSSSGSDSSSSTLGNGEVTATNLNVRASASSSSSIISSLRRGTTVNLHEKTGNWYKIKVGSRWGYIHADYVKMANQTGNSSSGSGNLSGKTIFLDPGHGGHDPGAVNGNIYEKTIVLNLSNKVKQALEREGAKVVMSRSDDRFIAIGTRVSLANQSNADLFISIHANSFGSSAASGSEVLYSETQYPAQSRRLATELQKAISSGMNMRDRGLVKRNLQVLTGPRMPAVLIEPGFMSNQSDLNKLLNQQDKMANEIVRGIKAYYN